MRSFRLATLTSFTIISVILAYTVLATGEFNPGEQAALLSVIDVRYAQIFYYTFSGTETFAQTLEELHAGTKVNGLCLIDENLASGHKSNVTTQVSP